MRRAALDKLGVVLSVGCGVHCVALSALAAALSLPGAAMAALGQVELPVMGLSTATAAASLAPGYRKHGDSVPAQFFMAGLVVLLSSRLVPAGPEHWVREAGLALGAAGIVVAHTVNARLSAGVRKRESERRG